MGMVPTSRQNNVLDALCGTAGFTAPVTGIKARYNSTLATASADGTELPNGGGYATGGTACSFSASSAGANANTTALSNTNSSGSTWTIESLSLNDFSANRFLYGAFTSQPISVPNLDTFAVAAGAITCNGSSW